MAYKVFWDKSRSRFTYESIPSNVRLGSHGYDSTTVWVDTIAHAIELTKLRNVRVEAEYLFVRECKDCGTTFMMEVDDYNWFIDNDLEPPVRCYKCRQKRKKK